MATWIRTVLGDIPPGELGVCYPHEHVLGQPPEHLFDPDLLLTDENAAFRELTWFKEAGGRAIVDMSTPDYGRDAAGLKRISAATGVHIVCATGFNKEKFSEPFLRDASVEGLAANYTREIEVGIGDTGVRAGLIKASSSLDRVSPLAEKMFRAAARAHEQTGAPISTHTEAGTLALEQIELLRDGGVDPRRVIIGHLDRKLDWEYLRAIAASGVYLGFDQVGKEKYYPDRERIDFILRLTAEGFGRQVLLSGDLAKRSYLPGYGTGGGPGLTYILWRFVPWLREAGLAEDAIQDLIVHNPARALSFARI